MRAGGYHTVWFVGVVGGDDGVGPTHPEASTASVEHEPDAAVDLVVGHRHGVAPGDLTGDDVEAGHATVEGGEHHGTAVLAHVGGGRGDDGEVQFVDAQVQPPDPLRLGVGHPDGAVVELDVGGLGALCVHRGHDHCGGGAGQRGAHGDGAAVDRGGQETTEDAHAHPRVGAEITPFDPIDSTSMQVLVDTKLVVSMRTGAPAPSSVTA